MSVSASVDICRKLTGAMRLFDAGERESAISRFFEMVEKNGIAYTDLRICPADITVDDDDSYLLHMMQAKIDEWEERAKKAEIQVTALKKQLDAANCQNVNLSEQLTAAKNRVDELSKLPPTKVTYARWQCLDDLANGDEITDKRSFTACLKAGWATEDGKLTPAGLTMLKATEEPPAPKPRVSVKKLKADLAAVEQERDEAYDRIDEILTVLDSPTDYSVACAQAVRVIKTSARGRHAAH
jgi:hypothetical protein